MKKFALLLFLSVVGFQSAIHASEDTQIFQQLEKRLSNRPELEFTECKDYECLIQLAQICQPLTYTGDFSFGFIESTGLVEIWGPLPENDQICLVYSKTLETRMDGEVVPEVSDGESLCAGAPSDIAELYQILYGQSDKSFGVSASFNDATNGFTWSKGTIEDKETSHCVNTNPQPTVIQ